MKRRRISFTATAQRQVQREKAWWLQNRVHIEVLATELEAALGTLELLPGVGTLYSQPGVASVRRFYLLNIACHLYDTFDDDEIVIRAMWGARRGRGP